MNELVPSVSIDNLLQKRDAMVERVHVAARVLGEVEELGGAMLGDNIGWRLTLKFAATGRQFTVTGAGGPEHMVKEIDAKAWTYLLEKSGLQSFLDAEARKRWRDAIDKLEVPPLTRSNIEQTFSSLYASRGEMFERGVIAVFRRLSWVYKTNTPVMFGKRLVLRNIVDVTKCGSRTYLGGVSFHGANELDDLIRVMSVLDGQPEPDHRDGTYHTLNRLSWMRDDDGNGFDRAMLHNLIEVRGFKNGNGHLTFMRPDLVDKMNRIVAKHHPDALPASRAA